MARRYFNWTLAVVLLVAVAVFAGAVFALHRWQRSSKAERALPLGEKAYEQGSWDEAAEQLGQYLMVRRDDVAVLLKYAEAQRKRRPATSGHLQQARDVYRSILRLDENNAEAAERLTELYLMSANPAEAEKVAGTYVGNNDDPNVRRMLAVALAQQGKYSEAEGKLLELVKDHPQDIGAYEVLGGLAAQHPADFNTAAADWYDRAAKANPQSAAAYVARGAFYRLRNPGDQAQAQAQALAELEQAAQCDLSDGDVRLRLAIELIRVRAYDRAKEHLTALQAQKPKAIMLWQAQAAVTLAAGTVQEREQVAEAGLHELAVYPWDFLPTAAELFVAANRPEKAQDCIARMREKGFHTGMLAFLDGLVASTRGNLWKATACWQDAIAKGHKTHLYAGGLGEVMMPVRMALSATYGQLGDLQSASVQLQTLVTEYPEYLGGRLAWARLMVRMRNWAGALEQAREVQRLVAPRTHTEAKLIELQARIFLLGDAAGSSADSEQAWQEINQQLEQLDQPAAGAVQAQAKLLRVQAFIRQDKFAEATKLLETATTADSSDYRAALLEAELLIREDKAPEAIASLRKVIERFPQEVEPVQMLARLLNTQKDQAQCESVIREAIGRMEQPGSRRDLGLLLADLYNLWARQDDLYRGLTEMAGQFPDDIRVKRGLLTCPAVLKDVQQAQKLVDQIKALEGEGPSGWQWRYEQARLWVNPAVIADANAFVNQYYAKTTAFMQENLLTNPGDQASRLLLAAAHERAGADKLPLALAAYREAYNRTPNNIVVITRLVAALQTSGTPADLEEAERILKDASEQQLYHPDLEKLELHGQAMQLQDQVRRGDLESASATLQELVQRDPNDVSASLSLAQILMRQRKLDEAEVILKELEAKAPSSFSVTRTRVQLCILRGNAQEAVRICDQTVQTAQKPNQAVAYLLRAWTYALLRENEKAAADFQQAIANDPNNAGLRVDRANFYQSAGRQQEAIQDVRRALALAAGNPAILARAVPLSLASGSRRLVEEAEAAVDKARAGGADSPELKVLKAQFLLRKGTRQSLEDGQRMLQEVTEVKPQLSQAWLLLGRLELGQGQPRRALSTALDGLSHNEQDRALLLLKADAEATRSWTLAVPTLESLAKQDPNDVEVEMRLANALYRSGNRTEKSEARSTIEKRMEKDPNNPVPVLTLIGLLIGEQRWTEVTGQVSSWLGKHPDDMFVVLATTRSLMGPREDAEAPDAEALRTAESLLTAAKERYPQSVHVLGPLAVLMQSTGRTAEAASLNRAVLDLDPNDVVALNNLAWVLCEEDGSYQEALELAERGLKIAPDYADLLDTRGVILHRLKKSDKAAEDFVKCIDLYPANARSLVSAHFHLARAYGELGQIDKAREHIQKMKEQDPQRWARKLTPKESVEATLLDEKLQKDR
ncbi:MAG: tetratricopeptide repeat protein [Sedimentisphaerales bacterium]|nr:tetratricopeptide repeat protein [Sedimentisphaerales bacterium]